MRRPPVLLLSLLTVGIAVGGVVGLRFYFEHQQARLERLQVGTLRERRAAWADARWQRQQELKAAARKQQDQWQREAAERRMAQRHEVESELGGPVQVVVKDPNLTLAEMIRRVALAASPANSQADVRVERFTEFDLIVSLPSLETRLALADCARRILEPCARYLNSIRFVYTTNVLAELDRRQMDRVQDWRTATRERVLELFDATARGRTPGSDSPGVVPSPKPSVIRRGARRPPPRPATRLTMACPPFRQAT